MAENVTAATILIGLKRTNLQLFRTDTRSSRFFSGGARSAAQLLSARSPPRSSSARQLSCVHHLRADRSQGVRLCRVQLSRRAIDDAQGPPSAGAVWRDQGAPA